MNPPTYFIENQQKKNKVGVVLGQNLGQIRSSVVKKVKKLALSIGFSHILHGEYILKQEVMVLQTHELYLARNVTFQELWAKFLPKLNQKMAKN